MPTAEATDVKTEVKQEACAGIDDVNNVDVKHESPVKSESMTVTSPSTHGADVKPAATSPSSSSPLKTDDVKNTIADTTTTSQQSSISGGGTATTANSNTPGGGGSGSEELLPVGKMQWQAAIDTCGTWSRLHVLLGVLDACIKWEKSAENAVSSIKNTVSSTEKYGEFSRKCGKISGVEFVQVFHTLIISNPLSMNNSLCLCVF